MKNQNIECLKFIAALGVVIIHYTSNFDGGDLNSLFNSVVRFAVPVFFMLSGYYYKYATKGFFKNLQAFFIVFAIYTVVFDTSTTFLWFLVPLAFMHLLFSFTKKVNIVALFVGSIIAYIVWLPVLGHASVTSYDYFILYGLNNVLIFAPCFLFGLLSRERSLPIKKFNFSFLILAGIIELILFVLNYHVVVNLAYQGSIYQFMVAGLIFLAVVGLPNYNHPKVLEKLYAVNFEVYLIHTLTIHYFFKFVEPLVNSFDMYYLSYTLVCFAFLTLVTFFAILLKKSRFLENIGVAR